MTIPNADKDSNRRNYFRVNQDVLFDCRPADHFEAQNGAAGDQFDDALTHSLVAQLRRIDHEAGENLKVLADRDRHLGDYLQKLSEKVDLIARHTLLTQLPTEQAHSKRINLSEAGIAFDSNKAFYKGKFVAVRLIFLPSYTAFMSFAEVVRCKPVAKRASSGKSNPDEEHFQVAARFHRLTDQDRQLLSRQIMKAQLVQRA